MLYKVLFNFAGATYIYVWIEIFRNIHFHPISFVATYIYVWIEIRHYTTYSRYFRLQLTYMWIEISAIKPFETITADVIYIYVD